MYILALNGSPRKNGTTAKLLNLALEGAASRGAEVELIQLSSIKMEGCRGCFSCKQRGGKSYGKCVVRDGMTALYEKLERADGLILGSPLYFHAVTASMKMFLERLYPYFSYANLGSNFPHKINVGLIYTMGASDEDMKQWYLRYMKINRFLISAILGPAEMLVSTTTFHVEDYTKIVADAMMPLVEQKEKHRREVFPEDCRKAYDMGVRFAGQPKSPWIAGDGPVVRFS